ncbi:Arginine N-succinyltransferase subunit beta [Pseudomonas aeruginosa]|nr:Arginine N-succinyltransferase subunit beta [Pseudomonas aeruginosa]
MIVRPVTSADLPALIELARSTGTGLTTLPANEQRLQHRVSWAEKAFRGEAERGDADYLFVLEDDAGKVVGISAIAGAVGLREPWYNYRVGLTVSASQELNIHREIPTLFLANDLTGNSELCSLFLHADHRSGLNGKLLSRARFLFIAEFRHLFGDKLIAEMRGMSDEEGRSPFWESLGRHFFKMEFSQADYLTGVGNKAFIAELMPKFPLYTCFLSEEARGVIGRVHPNTEPALAMLKAEGFSYQGYVDIFDAGPAIEAETDKIRAIAESQNLVLAVGTEMADTDFWRERLPLSGELIRVDIDPRKFNDFYPSAVALRGDARQTLEALLVRLPQEARDAAPAAARVARLRAEIRAAHAPLQALHQAILDRIAAALPADAFVSTDMTQLAYTGNYAFASRAPRSWLHPTGYGTLGYGLPAGIGAKLGAPQRPGLVLVGDGGFLYTAQELATASEELDSPLVVLLWNNDALGQIRDDMLGLDIEPVGVLPRNPDFALLGRAYGCAVRQPQDLDELERDLRAGFGQPGVTLIELRHACAR